MATRTKLIGTATTLVLTAILLWISFNQNYILTPSGDITCAGTPFYNNTFKGDISDCQVFWNVTSINYTYYFRNKQGIELGFSPEVNGFDMYSKDGRYNSGWRPLDKSGNFTYRKGIKHQFMAFIFKDINQTVKWKITAAEQTIDPILFGIDVRELKECTTITKTIKKEIYGTEIVFNKNTTVCSDFPINNTCEKISLGNSTNKILIGTYEHFINTTTCEDYGYNLSGHILYYSEVDWECKRDGLELCCEAPHQSDKNGKCDSGEGYCLFDIKTLSKQCTVSPTKQIRDLNFK